MTTTIINAVTKQKTNLKLILKRRSLGHSLLVSMAIMALSACGNSGPKLSELAPIELSSSQQQSYQQSCALCHEIPATGAPQTGNTEQWQQVFDKPLSEIMHNVINGYQGMPPQGQCFECSQQDLEQLVHFMSRKRA